MAYHTFKHVRPKVIKPRPEIVAMSLIQAGPKCHWPVVIRFSITKPVIDKLRWSVGDKIGLRIGTGDDYGAVELVRNLDKARNTLAGENSLYMNVAGLNFWNDAYYPVSREKHPLEPVDFELVDSAFIRILLPNWFFGSAVEKAA